MTITLKIEKKEVIEQEVEIQIPSFFRNYEQTNYVALLDEKTVVEIVSDKYENMIRNFDASQWSHPMSVIKEAYEKFHSCTETEFLEKYSEVEKAMSLHPILEP